MTLGECNILLVLRIPTQTNWLSDSGSDYNSKFLLNEDKSFIGKRELKI